MTNLARTVTSFSASGEEVLAFGPFKLDLVRHVLRKSGKPVRLGSRALEILLALVERAGQTVGTKELLARVWCDRVVEPSTVRVHMATLRKILGDGKSGARYVENVSGQGYRFAAPVTRVCEVSPPGVPSTPASTALAAGESESGSMAYRTDNLPVPLTRMLGRARELSTLVTRVPQRRFVTLTGPGGIGKTLLALNVAAALAPGYPHGTCFVDLAVLTEPAGVAGALATALRGAAAPASAAAGDPLTDILAFLQDKSMLVVLDNCEHVIEVAADLAEKVLRGAPGVHILATSREPLRAGGESVHRLGPLALPAQEGTICGAQALAFAAVELFVERAEASLDTFELGDAEVPVIVEICRRLDGNPLAIELAAAHVDRLGVTGLAASLEQRLHLVIKGQRTAPPRQQTLRATLDWSYELLPAPEQTILRRLSVLAGRFDLPSACAVTTDEKLDAEELFEGLTNLVAKSLLVADETGEKVSYRLLDTTRAYALEKLRDSEELTPVQQRSAAHMGRTAPGAGSGTLLALPARPLLVSH
jgi:predicted ATPase/DNA-binding winged helix-turn-helix (wHTH) protein